MNNVDIRVLIMESGLKHYQVAEKIGVSEGYFSRLLREELPESKKQQIREAVYKEFCDSCQRNTHMMRGPSL